MTAAVLDLHQPAPGARLSAPAILAIILVSYLLIILDNSVVFTSLPAIAESMALSPAGRLCLLVLLAALVPAHRAAVRR